MRGASDASTATEGIGTVDKTADAPEVEMDLGDFPESIRECWVRRGRTLSRSVKGRADGVWGERGRGAASHCAPVVPPREGNGADSGN